MVVKFLHSVLLLVQIAAIIYVLYSAITGQLGLLLWLAIGLVLVEGVIYLGFGLRCPLTMWAKHLGDETGHDLLGEWLLPAPWVRRVVPVCTSVFVVGLLWLAVSQIVS